MDPEALLSDLTTQWLEWDQDPDTRAEIQHLKETNNEAELEKRLRKRIQFGTAGLRAKMQAGFAFMNPLIVIQTSQGLAKFLLEVDADCAMSRGVVVASDARHNSKKYSSLVVNALLGAGIKVLWLGNQCVTPLVAFATKWYGAAAGVMITASHNPASDNGYKVYLRKGVQINSPNDAHIARLINSNLVPWKTAWEPLQTHIDHLHDHEIHGETKRFDYHAYDTVFPHWASRLREYTRSTVSEFLLPPNFMYTPLHGTGGTVFSTIMDQVGVGSCYLPVAEEIKPNPDFPNIPYPNPEENGALDLAIHSAGLNNRDILIANDPDADRLAVAQVIPGKTWYTFTGNQLGVLLASHILENLPSPNPKEKSYYMLNSTVSSSMLAKMCADYGVHHRETLTGFKWMGSIAEDLERQDYTHQVPFAFEEALGYMFPQVCYDKDGVTAASIFLLAAGQWHARGMTPFDKLQQLYSKYGHHETLNHYFRSPDPDTTASLFSQIRAGSWKKGSTFGSDASSNKQLFTISRWRDMTLGYDSDTPDNKPDLPIDQGSHMLTLWLDEDVKFTLRGSGTEPKVKFYIESWKNDQQKAIETVCDVFKAIRSQWVAPFAPSMTHADKLFTSSSYTLEL